MYSCFSLNEAIEGFKLSCQARRLSVNTIAEYSNTLRKLGRFMGDKAPADISRNDLRKFLSAQTEISKKTLQNYHSGLSVFFKWALEEELIEINPVVGIKRPKAEQRVITPIPEEHIRAIFKAINTNTYMRCGKVVNANMHFRLRHRALVLLLLDTGLRVSELCSIKKCDVDLEVKNLKVFGKNSKERILYYSPTTAHALWKYAYSHNCSYLFVTEKGRPLDRHNVRHLIRRLCIRANVPVYSPHDFRHTFAVNYLRNYPNIYALQQMLGHSTLDMVKRYLAISEQDIAQAHMHASPVEKWGL